MAFEGLIFDLGVSEGNDSAYYLAKGFRVVAVEADPAMVAHLRVRFAAEIEAGALKLLPFAAADTFGDVVPFHVHSQHQGVSGLTINPGLSPDGYHPAQQVLTIDWSTLLSLGTPRYVKIDIENNEMPFLAGMARSGVRPQFVSVECHTLDPARTLRAMGYRRFQLVDQNAREGFRLPAVQREGRQVDSPNFAHASGPFGLDVFAERGWLDYDSFEEAWTAAQPTRAFGTWFDCHAWMPPWQARLGGVRPFRRRRTRPSVG